MDQAEQRKAITTRRRIVEAVALIVGSTILIGTLSSIALLMYTAGSREATVHTIVIDEGANELIEQGQNPLEISASLVLLADDTLVLDNRDVVTHVLGSWSVPPNTIRSIELQPASGGLLAGSLHPSGAITLDVQPRDYDFRLIAVSTFAFGLSVGIVLWIGLNVARAMGGSTNDPYRRDEIEPHERDTDPSHESLGI